MSARNLTSSGNYFEDFELGTTIDHPTPRTIRQGDLSDYIALTGSRFLLQSSAPAARTLGLKGSPIDDLMAFHIVFGKSVPDISQNAVANLGYANGLFRRLVYPGDTISSRSEIIGLKENSNGKTGNVYVKTAGFRDDGELVLEYVRWVMVRKREPVFAGNAPVLPKLPEAVSHNLLRETESIPAFQVKARETGSDLGFEDYAIGDRIDHGHGMGVMESEHRLATRLYQNTAAVHFDDNREKQGRLGSTIVYGGVVMSIARSLSFNGLANALRILALNGGKHVNPCTGGSTIYAWSEVLDKCEIDEESGALRLRLVALKDLSASSFRLFGDDGKYADEVLLDLDLWVQIPKSSAIA